MAGIEILTYDKNNCQQDFQYMAKSFETNDYVIGYVIIQKEWYSRECDWIYYLVTNKYAHSFCGGANFIGFEKIKVRKDTIEPFTQIAKIKYNQSIGIDTQLVKKDKNKNENTVAYITPKDRIPIKLWVSKKENTNA